MKVRGFWLWLLLLLLAFPSTVVAQSPDEVNEIAKELYCPLCPGVRLDACDIPLCDQMREVIRQKLAAGETKEQIKAYFVEQYGSAVLGAPPRRGSALLVWVLPFAVLIVAGGWIYLLIQRWTRASADQGAEEATSKPLPTEYLERLEQELWEFD